MRLTEQDLKEIQQLHTARSERGAENCVSEDVLIRAVSKQLDRDEQKNLVNHLRRCSDCAREYRIVRSLKPWSETVAAESIVVEQVPIQIGDWRGARRTVEQSEARASWYRRLAGAISPQLSYALMAALLIMTVGLGFWVASLLRERQTYVARLNQQQSDNDRVITAARESLEKDRRQLAEQNRRAEQRESEIAEKEKNLARDQAAKHSFSGLSSPQLDAPIVDLDPTSDVRGSADQKPVEIEAVDLFTVILNFTDETGHSAYEVEILGSQSQRVWSGRKARRDRAQNLNVTLSRRTIPPGRYLIKLYGMSRGKRDPVASYALQVKYR